MNSTEKSAWIGAGSAITVCVITLTSAYFVSTGPQNSGPPTVLVRDPIVVREKETVREFYFCGASNTNNTNQVERRSTRTQLDDESQERPNTAFDFLSRKNIGIYYPIYNRDAESKAGELCARMRANELRATYFSVGRFYSKPVVPSATCILGLSGLHDETSFTSDFQKMFQYNGPFNLGTNMVTFPIRIEGSKWLIADDMDVYIFIGK